MVKVSLSVLVGILSLHNVIASPVKRDLTAACDPFAILRAAHNCVIQVRAATSDKDITEVDKCRAYYESLACFTAAYANCTENDLRQVGELHDHYQLMKNNIDGQCENIWQPTAEMSSS